VIESFDFCWGDKGQECGLKRTHPDAAHQSNRAGGEVSTATVDVWAYQCNKVVVGRLRPEEMGSSKLGVIGDGVRPADLKFNPNA
jgi:hypothetical protein